MTLTILCVFAAVFSGVLGLLLTVQRFVSSQCMKRRLSRIASDAAPGLVPRGGHILFKDRGSTDERLLKLPAVRAVQRKLERAGVRLPLSQFMGVGTLLLLSSFLGACLWWGRLLPGFVALAAVVLAAFVALESRIRRRKANFEAQLPEALTMMARSLRAGHSLTSSVELIAQELAEPARGIFRQAYEQQKLGVRITDALKSLRERVDSTDFDFFVTIVRINSESGGNLSEILDKLADTIRNRLQIRRQVQTYTAEGRLSGYVLVAMPLVVFALFTVLRPGYMDVFYKPGFCQTVLACAGVGQVVGYLLIRKIINIRI